MHGLQFTSPIAAALSVLALVGCEQKPPPSKPNPVVAEAAPPAPILPPPNIDRATFLQALDAAASAYAAGGASEPGTLAGRSFLLRQSFGCAGPAPVKAQPEPGHPSLTWGAKQESLELGLQPADWTQAPFMSGQTAWEAVEGFWLDRPWLRAEHCPASPSAQPASAPAPAVSAPAPTSANPAPEATTPTPPAMSAPTAGLAAVYPHGGSRLVRRDGRAFRHTVRGDQPLQAPQGGYRLVLEGRFTAFPDGRAIRCYALSVEARPVCVAAAEVDRIAFEDANGQLLSEWRRG